MKTTSTTQTSFTGNNNHKAFVQRIGYGPYLRLLVLIIASFIYYVNA